MVYREIVSIIIWPMKVIGINPLMKEMFCSSYLRILACCLSHIYGMYGTLLFSCYSNGDFYNAVIPIAYCTCLIMVNLAVIFLHTDKCRIRHLLLSFENYVFEYPDENNMTIDYKGLVSEKANTKLHFYMLFFEVAGFIISGSSPFVGYILVGRLRTFIYPGWVPWEVNSMWTYIVTYILQVPVASAVFWVYYVLQIYLMFVLVEFLRQFTKLRRAIETLHERTCYEVLTQMGCPLRLGTEMADKVRLLRSINYLYSEFSVSYRTCYNRIFEEKLLLCMQHHRKLKRLFDTFTIYYEKLYSMELMTVGVSFSLLLYCLVEESDPERYTSVVGVTWLLLSNLFCRCFIGEQFSAMNSRIMDTLFYETNWYEQSLENRKLISIFHQSTTRSLSLKGLFVVQSSFYSFSSIVRKSYSYFSLIRASQGDSR